MVIGVKMSIESVIKDKVLDLLSVDLDYQIDLSSDTVLQNVGMNSIMFIKLIVEIESIFNVEYPDEKLILTESGTLREIVSVINNILR
jgi:acyl carrier protein